MKCLKCGQVTNSKGCNHCGFDITNQPANFIFQIEKIKFEYEQKDHLENYLNSVQGADNDKRHETPKELKRLNHRYASGRNESNIKQKNTIRESVSDIYFWITCENIIRGFIIVCVSTSMAFLLATFRPLINLLGVSIEHVGGWVCAGIWFLFFFLFVMMPIITYFLELDDIIKTYGRKVLLLIPAFAVFTFCILFCIFRFALHLEWNQTIQLIYDSWKPLF